MHKRGLIFAQKRPNIYPKEPSTRTSLRRSLPSPLPPSHVRSHLAIHWVSFGLSRHSPPLYRPYTPFPSVTPPKHTHRERARARGERVRYAGKVLRALMVDIFGPPKTHTGIHNTHNTHKPHTHTHTTHTHTDVRGAGAECHR